MGPVWRKKAPHLLALLIKNFSLCSLELEDDIYWWPALPGELWVTNKELREEGDTCLEGSNIKLNWRGRREGAEHGSNARLSLFLLRSLDFFWGGVNVSLFAVCS